MKIEVTWGEFTALLNGAAVADRNSHPRWWRNTANVKRVLGAKRWLKLERAMMVKEPVMLAPLPGSSTKKPD